MLGSLIKSYNWRVNGLINLSAETVIARIVYGSEGIMLFVKVGLYIMLMDIETIRIFTLN